jgi:hypothetical protein
MHDSGREVLNLFKFLNRKQCPHTMTVQQNHIIIDEVRCVLDVDHAGHHRDASGKYVWSHPPSVRRFLEEKL